MKKILSIILVIALFCVIPAICVFAESAPEQTENSDEPFAYVSISDAKGELVLSFAKVKLRDIDDDGKLTVNDALYLAHEAKFGGGAKSGYLSYKSEFGRSLFMLWGDKSNAYGYCVNNTPCNSLIDEVKSGDHVKAYVYTDQEEFSDRFAYFSITEKNVMCGDLIDLTLSSVGYDENWQLTTEPVADAVVYINGKASTFKTDGKGSVTISFEQEGTYTVSAKTDHETIVPPVSRFTAEMPFDPDADKPSNDYTIASITAITLLVGAGAFGVWSLVIKKRR